MTKILGFSIVMIFMLLRNSESNIIQGEQPLSKIAIHKAVHALSHSSSVKAYPSFLGLKVTLIFSVEVLVNTRSISYYVSCDY